MSVPSFADSTALKILGFESGSEWQWKTAGEWRLLFMRLRSRLDLAKTVRLQRTVFGVSGARIYLPEFVSAAWFGSKGFASVVYGLLALESGVNLS